MKPDKEILQDLYEFQHLTSHQIAPLYGTSKTQVLRWLRSYDIPLRLPGIGMVAKGKYKPTQEELHELIHGQYLCYREIGQMFDVTKECVGYWVKAYGIPAPNPWAARKGGNLPKLPTREEFLELYEQGWSVARIGAFLDIPVDTLFTFCHKQQIEMRGTGFNGGNKFTCKDGHTVRSIYEQRVDDWLLEHGIEHVYEPLLPFDRRYRADFLANGWYIEIWGIRTTSVHVDPHMENQSLGRHVNTKYIQRHLRKLEQYKEQGLPLIEIYENHFDSRRNALWVRRLQAVLTSPSR